MSLGVDSDGLVTAHDGCNVLSGSWVATDDPDLVTFTALEVISGACPDALPDWLPAVASGLVTGDELTVQDDDGQPLATLERDAIG